MADFDVKLHGFDELEKRLINLDQKVAKKILRQATVEGAKVVQTFAEQGARTVDRKSFKHIVTAVSQKWGQVAVKIGLSKKFWYGVFAEVGTSGHTVKATNKKVLYDKKTNQFFGKEVQIPAIVARPFLRPALQNRINQVIQKISDTLRQLIENEVKL